MNFNHFCESFKCDYEIGAGGEGRKILFKLFLIEFENLRLVRLIGDDGKAFNFYRLSQRLSMK